MKAIYKCGDTVTTEIFVDDKTHKVSIINHTDKLIDRAFGMNEHPTYADFEELLESRCFPRSRDGLQWHLEALGLDHYDPLFIVMKTEGRMFDDDCSIVLEFEE